MALAKLPNATVRLIGSSQVITSVPSVVKELLENSIDSGATNIEIKLEKHGLEKIEVKDDGCGIKSSDATVMCLPSYTSKISDFSDLDRLSSYGFRGEALSSLCNVAQVSVTTKSADDYIASCYTYDNRGHIVSSKPSHITKGTIVLVTELFKNIPVRKQFLSNSKRAADELKKLEKTVKSLAMIHPRLRVTLVHNKFLIWQKTSVNNLRQSVMQVVSLHTVKQLHHILQNMSQIRVEMLVPNRECNVASLCFSNFSDAYFLFINSRPVRNKEVEKAVYNKIFEYFGVYIPTKKYPVCVTSLVVPADSLDVNLEPDKSRVLMKNQEDVLEIVTQCLLLYYGECKKENEEDKLTSKVKKRKIEVGGPEENLKKSNKENPSTSDEMASSQEYSSQSTEPSELELETDEEKCKAIETENVSRNDRKVDDSFVQFCLERNNETQIPIEISTFSPRNQGLENNYQVESISDQNTCLKKAYRETNYNVFENQVSFPNITTDETIKPLNTLSSHFVSTPRERGSIQKTNLAGDKPNQISVCNNTARGVKYGEEFVLPTSNDEMCENPENHTNDFVTSTGTNETQMDEVIIFEDDEPVEPKFHKKADVCKLKEKEQVSNLAGISLPTLSQWSRGDVSFEPKQRSGDCEKRAQASESSSPQSSQMPSNRSVSSQMGCKEMSAFTKFARNMRKRILEENPSMSFARVAQQLQVQWRQLNTEERKEYENSTYIVKSTSSPEIKQKQKTLSSYLERRPNIELDFNFESFKEEVKNSFRSGSDKPGVSVVGQLEASSLWVYVGPDTELELCCVRRLQEAVKFHQHLACFALTTRLLDQPIRFTATDLGECDWSLLLTLDRSPNGVVTDSRLVSNGFMVDIVEGELEGYVTYVPQHISYCGVEEVQEVLALLRRHGLYASLAQCRPLKVISFLRSEAMRDCSKAELPSGRDEVHEFLDYWLTNVLPETADCIHHLPVSQRLLTHGSTKR